MARKASLDRKFIAIIRPPAIDAEGKIVFRFDSPDRADSSLSPRQDYCHVGRFTMPVLPAGAYTLWLKATDVPTGRTARAS